MMERRASVSGFEMVIAIGFALTAILLDKLLVPVPLYLTEGCAPNSCVNVAPRIHVVPLMAGVLAASIWSFVRARHITPAMIGFGLLMGVIAVLLVGMLEAAALPFTNPYFTTVYRLWGLAVVFTIAALGVLVALRSAWVGSHPFLRTALLGLGLVLVGAIAAAMLRREVLVAAAAAAGVAAGVLAARFGPQLVAPRPAHALAAVIVVTFVSRALFGLQTLAGTGPGMAFAVASDDGDSYFTLATRLAGDLSMLSETLAGIAFPPGYTVFLAAIFAVTGGSLAAVIVTQAALAAVGTYCVFVLGRRIFGVGTGLLGAGMFALDQNLIQNASTLTAEALLMPLVLASLAAASSYATTRNRRHLLLAAVLVGLAFVTRNLVAMPLLVALTTWLVAIDRKQPLRIARNLGLVAALTLAWSLPIAVATAQKDGQPRLTTQLAGLAWTFDGGHGYTIPNRVLVARGIDPFADPLGSLSRAAADPGFVAGFYKEAAPQRFATLMFFANRGYSDPLIIVNEAYFPNAFGETVRLLRIAVFLAGAWFVLRTRAWRTAPEVSLIAAYALLYVSIFVFLFPPYHAFRYRIPVEPVRFLFEAGGIAAVWAGLTMIIRASQVSGQRLRFPGDRTR